MKEENFDFYSKTSLKEYNLDEAMRYQLSMLDSLDAFTRKHSEHVANLTCRICEYLHASTQFTVYCTICAYLHDIGKLFIPSSILQKTSALSEEEFQTMKTHTTIRLSYVYEGFTVTPLCSRYHLSPRSIRWFWLSKWSYAKRYPYRGTNYSCC